MTHMTRLIPPIPDDDTCWQAFLARDRAMDGRFVGCVSTTGIYCKPSCGAAGFSTSAATACAI
nr:hypothetical protein [Sphingobium sp.]